jgi:hypothetical protein
LIDKDNDVGCIGWLRIDRVNNINNINILLGVLLLMCMADSLNLWLVNSGLDNVGKHTVGLRDSKLKERQGPNGNCGELHIEVLVDRNVQLGKGIGTRYLSLFVVIFYHRPAAVSN